MPAVSLFRPKVKRKKGLVQTKVWWAAWRDEAGRLHRQSTGCRDKGVARQAAAKIQRNLELGLVGLDDPYKEHRVRKLTDHLKDFEKFKRAEKLDEQHVVSTVQRCTSIIESCKFITMADIDAVKVQTYMGAMKRSASTQKHYLTAMRNFCNWLVTHKRMEATPLDSLVAPNVEAGRVRVRGVLPQPDFDKLLVATANGPVVEGATGKERCVMYVVAAVTGLRKSEIASLTKPSFDFSGEIVTVTIAASDEKSKRGNVLPIPVAWVPVVRAWVESVSDGLLFPSAARRTAEMLRDDLAAAGLSDRIGDTVIDFHALRHSFVTWLAQAGVPLTTAQRSARHSTPVLTSNVYSHVDLADRAAAADKLPVPSPLFQLAFQQAD